MIGYENNEKLSPSFILDGGITVHRIMEDENILAFLSPFPKSIGHVVIMHKKQHQSMFDLSIRDYALLWLGVHNMVEHLEKILRVPVFIKTSPQPFFTTDFIHLVPFDSEYDGEPLEISNNQLVELTEKLKYGI